MSPFVSPSSSKWGSGAQLHVPLWRWKGPLFVVQNNVCRPPRLQSHQYKNISNTMVQVSIYDILVSSIIYHIYPYAHKSRLNAGVTKSLSPAWAGISQSQTLDTCLVHPGVGDVQFLHLKCARTIISAKLLSYSPILIAEIPRTWHKQGKLSTGPWLLQINRLYGEERKMHTYNCLVYSTSYFVQIF